MKSNKKSSTWTLPSVLEASVAEQFLFSAARIRRKGVPRNMLIVFENRDAVGFGLEVALRQNPKIGKGDVNVRFVWKELEKRIGSNAASQWIPDKELWSIDLGPEHTDYGCDFLSHSGEDEKFLKTARTDLVTALMSGDGPEVCPFCIMRSKCYWRDTLRHGKRVIGTFAHRAVFDPFCSVLADRPHQSGEPKATNKEAIDWVKQYVEDPSALLLLRRVIARKRVQEFVDVYAGLKMVRDLKRGRGDAKRAATMLLEHAYVDAVVGKLRGQPMVRRELVMPRPARDGTTARLGGHFLVFEDNYKPWQKILEPLGATLVHWSELGELLALPKTFKQQTDDEQVEVIGAARDIMDRGDKLTWASLAKEVGISLTKERDLNTYRRRFTQRGLSLKTIKSEASKATP